VQSVGDEELTVSPDYEGFLETMDLGHRRGARHAAIELTSAALALGFLRGWRCRIGVFTNLSHDHLDMHRSPEHYLASKAQLFVQLPKDGTAVLNAGDPASQLLDEVIAPEVTRWTYAQGQGAVDLAPSALRVSWQGTEAELAASPRLAPLLADVHTLSVPAIGDIYLVNALGSFLAAIAAGVPAAAAAAAIARTPPPLGRFQVVAERPHVVIDYAHSPDALERTLRVARDLRPARVVLVMGAGGGRDQEKREPMGRAAAAADRVILTSDNPRDEDAATIAKALHQGLADHGAVTTILDRRAAIAAALEDAAEDDLVLIAGKGHESVQLTDAGAVPFSDAEVVRGLLER
jgi:UDP-N-acetylmuramoyl-L-alanyl-D-glutamate--2,6-diaminopimelate ligase